MNNMISIITLTHNKLEYTRKCLPTILASTHRPLELIVIENGSTDGTVEWLKDFSSTAEKKDVRLVVIQNKSNIGCSTARNQGAEKSSGENLVFMDNDVAVRDILWLDKLSNMLYESKNIAAAGPKLVYPVNPFNIQCAGVGISKTGRVQFIGRGEKRDDPRFNRKRDIQCLTSACIMTKKAAFGRAQGFDEAFNPVQFEDFDLCYRIRSKGYRIVFVPEVEMYHFESVTTAGTPTVPNTYVIIKNGLRFKKRWKYMFEKEDGPQDSETRWRNIPPVPLETIGDLPRS